MSHSNWDDYIENLKYINKTNDTDDYKEDTSQHKDGNEIVDNPETIDTSLTDKDDMPHTNRDDYIENVKDMKNSMMMTNTKRKICNIKTVMKVLST